MLMGLKGVQSKRKNRLRLFRQHKRESLELTLFILTLGQKSASVLTWRAVTLARPVPN